MTRVILKPLDTLGGEVLDSGKRLRFERWAMPRLNDGDLDAIARAVGATRWARLEHNDGTCTVLMYEHREIKAHPIRVTNDAANGGPRMNAWK